MYFLSVIRELASRVRVYAVFGGVLFPAWFFWNVKEAEFLYVGGYLMHFVGGIGAGLLAAAMSIGACNAKTVTKRFYWIIFSCVFVWLTVMEWMQAFHPWRSFQWEDILAQTIGLLVALAIVWWNEKHVTVPAFGNRVAAE